MKPARKWLLRLFLFALVCVVIVSPVAAQEWRFQVNERIVHVYVNDDGSIWIDYTITYTPDPGSHPLDIIDIGLPNYDYSLGEVSADVGGNSISDIRHSEVVQPGVEVHMGKYTIQPGETGTLHVLARVRNMVFQDTSDPDYASMEFSPHWYDSANAHGSMHLEIIVHFPTGVTPDEARYHDTPFTDAAIDDEGRVTYAWIYEDASPSRQYKVGISFPKKYLKSGLELVVTPEPISSSGGGVDILGTLCSGPFCFLGALVLFIIGIVVITRRAKSRKMKYLPPSVAVEGAGVKRGLTAVEAAILLEAPLNKVLTMILFGLLKKGAVTVESDDPLTLQAREPLPEDLRPYETEFLACISKKRLDEKQLRKMTVGLIKDVNEKMKGFSRKDSVAYYKDLVRRAWEQVESAATPEVKSQRLDDGLEWTMLDEDWSKRVGRSFGDEPVILPPWWMYYRPWATTSASPTPQPAGSVTGPRPSATSGTGGTPTMPTLPGAAFANTIVGGFEGLSNRVVSSVERFTSNISSITNPPPPPPKSSGGRWGGGSKGGGGCACACACACAGCACACAGGGR